MAYMNQQHKKEIAENLKPILKKHNVKGTLSVRHYSTLVLTVSKSPIDFIGNYNKVSGALPRHQNTPFQPTENYIQINPYWFKEHFDGIALEFFIEAMQVMNNGNHDRSDIQTDYFDVGWYVDINIGRWNKPYQLS